MTTTTLPAEIRPVLDNGMPAVMVTCSADGIPNVTVISQVYFVDEHHAALSFQFFSKTIRNVRENPRAYVCVSDIAGQVEWILQLKFQRSETEGADLRGDGHADRGDRLGDRHVRYFQAAGRRYLPSALSREAAVRRASRGLMIDSDSEERARMAADLARKTAEFQVLQRVSSELNSTLELDEIYDAALRTMGELFEFHHANILLLEPGGDTLIVVASRGYENQAIGGRVRVGTGVIGIVAQKRKMLHVSNLGQQRAYAAAQRQQMMKAGRAAELADAVAVPGLPNAESQFAIPLLVRDELIGVFSIESPVQRTFAEHDRALLSIIANHIASAIHNAQLYEERRRTADQLQAMNASLEARVAERTAALERELRVAEDLLKDARSRIDGPLVGDSAAVRALRAAVAEQAARRNRCYSAGRPAQARRRSRTRCTSPRGQPVRSSS